MTLADSGIESVADLEGKRVAIGDIGSGTEANATQILEAHGLSVDDVNAQALDFADASTNLQDGNVDAAFVTAGTPTGAIQELSASADVKIISFDQEAIDSLMEEYTYYVQEDIPADAYDNFDSTATTVAVQAMLIASNDIPEDQMYEITSVIFDNLDDVANAMSEERNCQWTLHRMACPSIFTRVCRNIMTSSKKIHESSNKKTLCSAMSFYPLSEWF